MTARVDVRPSLTARLHPLPSSRAATGPEELAPAGEPSFAGDTAESSRYNFPSLPGNPFPAERAPVPPLQRVITI